MKYIEYDVKNMVLSRAAEERNNPISGAINYFGVHFNLDEEFKEIAGTKSAEFYKSRNTYRVDLVDGQCAIPNEILSDKTPFEMRIISGNMVATPWVSVQITESGAILPETPEEELPETLDYVKTPVGDSSISMFRRGDTGLEYSQNGEDWENGINGIPDVPKTPANATYVRKNGDWVQYEAPESVEGLVGEATAIEELTEDAELVTVIAKINEVIGILRTRGVIE